MKDKDFWDEAVYLGEWFHWRSKPRHAVVGSKTWQIQTSSAGSCPEVSALIQPRSRAPRPDRSCRLQIGGVADESPLATTSIPTWQKLLCERMVTAALSGEPRHSQPLGERLHGVSHADRGSKPPSKVFHRLDPNIHS